MAVSHIWRRRMIVEKGFNHSCAYVSTWIYKRFSLQNKADLFCAYVTAFMLGCANDKKATLIKGRQTGIFVWNLRVIAIRKASFLLEKSISFGKFIHLSWHTQEALKNAMKVSCGTAATSCAPFWIRWQTSRLDYCYPHATYRRRTLQWNLFFIVLVVTCCDEIVELPEYALSLSTWMQLSQLVAWSFPDTEWKIIKLPHNTVRLLRYLAGMRLQSIARALVASLCAFFRRSGKRTLRSISALSSKNMFHGYTKT